MNVSDKAYGVFNQVFNLIDVDQVGPLLEGHIEALEEAGHSEQEVKDFLQTLDSHFFRLKIGQITDDAISLKLRAHQELVRLRGLKALSTLPVEA